MKSAKTTAIDASGRVLIPKSVREQAALSVGAPLEAAYENGCIVLQPMPLPVRMEKQGAFVVAVPARSVAPMSEGVVEQTLGRIRGERGVAED
jgi:bifunctional DNA-binding transcriptional regulator/antitoxin component of YhaV-PrlF toxin-antitoxin module